MSEALASAPNRGSSAELDFSDTEIQTMLDNLDAYTSEEVVEIEKLVDELATRRQNKLAYADLMEFCQQMQSDYIVGKHHRLLANMLMDIEQGNKDRICVNIPPRHGKSQLVSIYFPAWFLGRNVMLLMLLIFAGLVLSQLVMERWKKRG